MVYIKIINRKFVFLFSGMLVSLQILFIFQLHSQNKFSANNKIDTITILYNKDSPANIFVPEEALGAGIDGHEKDEDSILLSPKNIDQMRAIGLKSLTYRLRTELGQEVWHWNPHGKWSDENMQQGYWISDSSSPENINISNGYSLPRRGCTFDQANNNGYSRIDDGDMNTFWKSNPYLDSKFTGEPDSSHPQWVVVDLGEEKYINTLIIHWAEPFSVDFKIEYAENDAVGTFNNVSILGPYTPNIWKPLPDGNIKDCKGGNVSVQFSSTPLKLRIIRILCLKSSGTASNGSNDLRDSCGYAIREIELGINSKGKFIDYVKHGNSRKIQSVIHVSTTDPWHRAIDIDTNTEQPGIDFIYANKLNNQLPVLFPVGVVYDIPENALALIKYLRSKKYPFKELELGEEPDGQYISPKDFACLYLNLADKIKTEYPELILGGPSFQGITPNTDSATSFTQKQWLNEFVQYLKQKNKTNLFQFFSFEWYPFDGLCKHSLMPQLLQAPGELTDALRGIMKGILPAGFPIYITEYGFSVLGTEAEVSIEGALLNADIVGHFLTMGGSKAYLYGYEPGSIMNENGCSWGNLITFGMDSNNVIDYKTGLYHSATLYAQKWAQPISDTLKLYPVNSSIKNNRNQQLVSAYALKRPDGKFGLMLINKDEFSPIHIFIQIKDIQTSNIHYLNNHLEIFQFGKKEYHWNADEENGKPFPNNPPTKISNNRNGEIILEPYSITVINEN